MAISGSVDAQSRDPAPRAMAGTTKDRTKRLEAISVYIMKKKTSCDLEAGGAMFVLLVGVCGPVTSESFSSMNETLKRGPKQL